METRANFLIVGLFTLAVIASGFAFVWWFARPGERTEGTIYEVAYDGPVSGLRAGSTVNFNGIRVGEVRGLRLDPRDPRRVIATLTIQESIPIRADTRAGLEYQGLTGISSVALTGGAPGAPALPKGPDGPPRLVAEGSSVQDLLGVARRLAGQAEGVLARLDRLVADNEGDVRRVISNAAKFSDALGNNAAELDTFLKDASGAAKRLAALSEKAEALAGSLDSLVKAVEPKRVTSIIENVDAFTQGLAGSTDKFTALVADAQSLAARLNTFSGRLDGTFDRVDAVLAAADPAKVRSAIDGVEAFAKRLGDNSPKVDQIMSDASELARKLNGMADRLDKVLANVEGFTGGGEGKGLFAELSAAARSIRELANNFDKRGLREFESLATDGRRTLGEIERTFRNFERNPRQFLFGGSGVPEYSGRR